MEFTDAKNNAIGELIDLVASRLGSERAVHSATAIASIARLSGSLLLRTFQLKLEGIAPGTPVLSNEANEKGPQLMNIFFAILQGYGIAVDGNAMPDSKKAVHTPNLTVIQSLELLQNDAIQITQRNGLSLEDTAQAGAVATAFIVKECAKDIGADVGAYLATYGFIEGCKTVPPKLVNEPKSNPA